MLKGKKALITCFWQIDMHKCVILKTENINIVSICHRRLYVTGTKLKPINANYIVNSEQKAHPLYLSFPVDNVGLCHMIIKGKNQTADHAPDACGEVMNPETVW